MIQMLFKHFLMMMVPQALFVHSWWPLVGWLFPWLSLVGGTLHLWVIFCCPGDFMIDACFGCCSVHAISTIMCSGILSSALGRSRYVRSLFITHSSMKFLYQIWYSPPCIAYIHLLPHCYIQCSHGNGYRGDYYFIVCRVMIQLIFKEQN